MSAPPPSRALVVPHFIFIWFTMVEGYLLGLALRLSLGPRRLVSGKHLGFSLVLILLMLSSFYGTQRVLALEPILSKWAFQWDQHHEEILIAKSQGRTVVTPANGWVVTCIEKYYGLDSITIE
jgi:hypothetical protein